MKNKRTTGRRKGEVLYYYNCICVYQKMFRNSIGVVAEGEEEIKVLESEISNMKYEIASLKANNEILSDNNKARAIENANNYSKARFLDNHIGLVVESGTKYHKYGCHYVEDKTFWAYNIEAAARGYTPCSVCYSNSKYPSLADVQSGKVKAEMSQAGIDQYFPEFNPAPRT